MVDTNELESFLNERSAKEADICEITGDGVIEQKEDPLSHRKYKVISFAVKLNGKDLTWTPDKEALAVFQNAYGFESKSWIGKKFTIKFYPKMVFGKKKTAIMPVLVEVKK